jgi:hypothetical protein
MIAQRKFLATRKPSAKVNAAGHHEITLVYCQSRTLPAPLERDGRVVTDPCAIVLAVEHTRTSPIAGALANAAAGTLTNAIAGTLANSFAGALIDTIAGTLTNTFAGTVADADALTDTNTVTDP